MASIQRPDPQLGREEAFSFDAWVEPFGAGGEARHSQDKVGYDMVYGRTNSPNPADALRMILEGLGPVASADEPGKLTLAGTIVGVTVRHDAPATRADKYEMSAMRWIAEEAGFKVGPFRREHLGNPHGPCKGDQFVADYAPFKLDELPPLPERVG